MPDTQLLVEVYRMQGEMNAKLDALIGTTARHGKRITILERKWTRMFSWLTVVGSTVTLTFNYLLRRDA